MPNSQRHRPKKRTRVEHLVGGVVYAIRGGELFFAFVHDVFGYWTLSKGKVERGENEEEALVREIKEELGLKARVGEKLGTNSYLMYHPERGRIRKEVSYFLAQAAYEELVLEKKEGGGGLDDARWATRAEISELNLYEDIRTILDTAFALLDTPNA